MSSWRDDPEALAAFQEGEQEDSAEEIRDRRWAQLDATLTELLAGADFGGGLQARALKPAIALIVRMFRASVAKDPEGMRQRAPAFLRVIVAGLEIEPAELYPGLRYETTTEDASE